MKKTIKILLLTAIAIVGMSIFSKVSAASASAKASKAQVSVGDNATVTITINAAAWNLKVTGAASKSYVGNTDDLKNKTTTDSIKIDTSSTGSKTIVLSGDITDESGKTTTVNSTATIVVNEKTASSNNNSNNNNNTSTKKSSDTSLKSVTVGGKSYTIGKSITVDANTSSITIKATANSSKAKVTGTGTKELETGTNNFSIKVTAEDGSSKTYKVTVIREEFVGDPPNIDDPSNEAEQELRLTALSVEGFELIPVFSSEVFEYAIYVTNETEVKINATANVEGTNIEITGNTGIVEGGDNVALIKLTKDDKVTEYRVKINKSAPVIGEENENTINDEENEKVGFIGTISNWWNNSGPGTVVLVVILVLFGAAAIFAIISYKYSGNAKGISRHGVAQNEQNLNLFGKDLK